MLVNIDRYLQILADIIEDLLKNDWLIRNAVFL